MPTARQPSTLPKPGPGGRRSVWLPAMAGFALLGAGGCTSSDGGTSGSATGSSSPATSATTAASGTTSSSPASSTSTSTSPATESTTPPAAAGGLPTDHSVCVLIDFSAATTLLGSKPTTIKIPDTSDDMVTHVDRCNWATARGSLTYQVNRYANPSMPATIVAGLTSHLPPGGTALDFPPSGKGFVVAIGPKAMGRAVVPLTGGIALDLSTTAPTPDQAQALLRQLAGALTQDIKG